MATVKRLFSLPPVSDDVDELSPSLYSYQTDPEENKKFMLAFSNCGIETAVVDRAAKKERIKQWIQSSVIEEEDEEDTCSEEASRMSGLSRRSSGGGGDCCAEENELYHRLTVGKRDTWTRPVRTNDSHATAYRKNNTPVFPLMMGEGLDGVCPKVFFWGRGKRSLTMSYKDCYLFDFEFSRVQTIFYS